MKNLRLPWIMLFAIVGNCLAYGQVYLKDILYNGGIENPHKIYTRAEIESVNFNGYSDEGLWVIRNNGKSKVIDNESFWGLMNGDFYKYYHNTRIDLSTPLKQKAFEKSEEYAQMKEEMEQLMQIVRGDSFHFPFYCMGYDHVYDIENGGFNLEFEIQSGFPTIMWDGNKSHSSPMANGAPNRLVVYESKLKDIITEYQGWKIRFFTPIANEDVAIGIENTRDDGYYLDDINYGFLMKCKYIDKAYPVIEIEDIILVRSSDNQVVWSATTGDLSQNLKKKPTSKRAVNKRK